MGAVDGGLMDASDGRGWALDGCGPRNPKFPADLEPPSDGLGSRRSFGCTKNQIGRPILRQLRGNFIFSGPAQVGDRSGSPPGALGKMLILDFGLVAEGFDRHPAPLSTGPLKGSGGIGRVFFDK